MIVAAVASAFPRHYYTQDQLIEAFRSQWAGRHHNSERFERLHHNVLVGGRHLALPLERYPQLASFGEANDEWIRVGLELAEQAVAEAAAAAGIELADIGELLTVSVTGIATPSLDARLMNRLDLPRGLKRVPIFGLGCVAGAAGLARAADYVRAYPDQAAVLLSVELCQ
jgi:alkylresorcinol/alkylpyrone synthase